MNMSIFMPLAHDDCGQTKPKDLRLQYLWSVGYKFTCYHVPRRNGLKFIFGSAERVKTPNSSLLDRHCVGVLGWLYSRHAN